MSILERVRDSIQGKMTLMVLMMAGVMMMIACGGKQHVEPEAAPDKKPAGVKVVEVELYLMSQCPYGIKVIHSLNELMNRMGSYIDLKVNYIGKVTEDGGFSSLHGQNEVDGDMYEICAFKHADDQMQGMKFLVCQSENYKAIPAFWEECAKKAEIDVAKLKSCFDGEEGKALLAASFKKSSAAKAYGCPTLTIQGDKYTGAHPLEYWRSKICEKLAVKPAGCR